MVLQELTKRIKIYHAFQIQQLTDRPEYGMNGDIRISALTKILSSMTGYQLALAYSENELADNNWWAQRFGNQVNQDDIELRTSTFNNITLIGFYQGLFMSIESSFRSISFSINPNANNSGKSEFYNIYNFIFNSINLQKYSPLFDILRLVRNTVHNNGLFIPKNGGDISITYDGKLYEFKENELVPYLNQMDNANLYYFLDQILLCLKDIFTHPIILAIPKIEEKVNP